MLSGSINTNLSAQLAVEVLGATNSALQGAENHISTGDRMADATDDGAASAVAHTEAMNAPSSARGVLVDRTGIGVQGSQRTQYEQQYNSLVASVKAHFQDASYTGSTLLADLTGGSGTSGNVSVIRNEVGDTYGVNSYSGSEVYTSVAFTGTELASSTAVAGLITASGTFLNQIDRPGTALNTYDPASNYLSNQVVTYNNTKIDALNTGLGALVDADLTKESARLQALQTQQQLTTQSLSTANQAPQSLLKLFQ